jgi:hypothetical protein
MTDRMDLVATRSYTTRDGEVKTAFTRIGVAFPIKSGWSLSFEALPLPSLNDKGQIETRVLMMVPKDKKSDAPPRDFSDMPGAGTDDIPF